MNFISRIGSVSLGIACFLGSILPAIANSPIETMSPELADAWQTLDDNSHLTAIVYLIQQVDIATIDLAMTRRHATRQFRHEIVVNELREVAIQSQQPLLARLAELKTQGRVVGFTAYWIVNAIVVQADRSALLELSERDEVDWMDLNFRPRLHQPVDFARGHLNHLDENHGIPTGIRALGAPRVWYELGFTGAGRLVGNIDTGVDGTHPALSSRWRGVTEPAEECWLDVISVSQFPEDDSPDGGHGTHVMGTICGNSNVSNDSIGVAPGAQWIACNAIDQGSSGDFDNDILNAFQWMSDPDGNSVTIDDVPDVVHNSWGVDGRFPGYTDCYQVWNEAIVNCEAAGVVVTFSAGNEGSAERTLRSPATVELDSVTVFTVGAVDADADTIAPYEIASFSSRGPSDCPPFLAIKPEVCAPGVDVYSSFPDGNYIRLSGTSMAGPHVAGIVALMREANPNAEVREIKSVLMRTALDYGPEGEDNAYGFGFVNAYEAVLEISANRGIVTGIVTDEGTGEPIEQAVVRAGSRQRRTDSEGRYTLSLPGDSTWTISFEAYGYLVETQVMFLGVAETLQVNAGLTALPQGTLRGVVRAGENVPVAGAEISFTNAPLPSVLTDENGEFELNVPGDSSYNIVASYDGVETDTTAIVPLGGATDVSLQLVTSKSLPQGPDTYGYRAYDNLDNGIPPSGDWLEIAPSRGGMGTLLAIQNRDSSAYVAMPFLFDYYGTAYDSLTINENGWIAAGISHDHSFFNFEIPGASGPRAMLALFWDNLQWVFGESELCVYHDTLGCRFVIEYVNFLFAQTGELQVTCQLQIYDSESWPTPTGDSEIKMLYERIDVPNSSTVGIENNNELVGVECLFNGDHADNTWGIRSGRTILFTTRTEPWPAGSVVGHVIAHPEPTSWSETKIRVGCDVVEIDDDGEFSMSSAITGNPRIELLMPGYESADTVLPVGQDSVTTWTVEVWRLDPPRDLTGSAMNDTLTLTWSAPESVAGSLDELIEYDVYRDGVWRGSSSSESYRDAIVGIEARSYYVTAVYRGGESDTSNHFMYDPTNASPELSGTPQKFAVSSLYPNPFNPETKLTVALPHNVRLTVVAYDVLGRAVATIADEHVAAGYHTLNWHAESLPSGLYFLRIEAGVDVTVRKALLLK